MSDEEIRERMTKCQGLWRRHGSWILLAVVGLCCYMAGQQVSTMNAGKSMQMMIQAHADQDADRIMRIQHLIDRNRDLSVQIARLTGEVSQKVESAAQTAERASETAAHAVSQSNSDEPKTEGAEDF